MFNKTREYLHEAEQQKLEELKRRKVREQRIQRENDRVERKKYGTPRPPVGRYPSDAQITANGFGFKDFKNHWYVNFADKHPLMFFFGIPLLVLGGFCAIVFTLFLIFVALIF